MKFKAQFSVPHIDVSAYQKTLDRYMTQKIAEALLVWLEAVINEIPVWSGASRATFMKVAQRISFNIPIVPVTRSRISRGMDESTGGLEPFEKGRYVFYYSTMLPWLIWNEYHNANVDPDPTKWPPPVELLKPGPYNFQFVGAKAFLRFADSVDLPAVKPFVQGVRVKF